MRVATQASHAVITYQELVEDDYKRLSLALLILPHRSEVITVY